MNEIVELLRARADRYFPEFDGKPVRIEQSGGGGRVLSSVYEFRLRAGGIARDLIVKLPGPNASIGLNGRPYLKAPIDQRSKFAREHTALRAIEKHFKSLGDPRFGSVRILDFYSDHYAIVMERSRHRSLKSLLLRTNRLQHAFVGKAANDAIENAGAWLRSYHSMAPLADAALRNDTRDRFVTSIGDFVDYLGGLRCEPAYASNVARRVADFANTLLPDTFPTAMGHGDFAPRNILVGPGARVSIIDTLGVWRPAIFEDIGFFLGALRTSRVQALTRGIALSEHVLESQEQAFLRGYFQGDKPPAAVLALFVIQALLDKWCAHAERVVNQSSKRRRVMSVVKDDAIDALLRREIDRRLTSIRACA